MHFPSLTKLPQVASNQSDRRGIVSQSEAAKCHSQAENRDGGVHGEDPEGGQDGLRPEEEGQGQAAGPHLAPDPDLCPHRCIPGPDLVQHGDGPARQPSGHGGLKRISVFRFKQLSFVAPPSCLPWLPGNCPGVSFTKPLSNKYAEHWKVHAFPVKSSFCIKFSFG